MDRIYTLLLDALKSALSGELIAWGQAEVSPEEMGRLMDLSQQHHILPVIFDVIYACPAAAAMDGVLYTQCRAASIQSVLSQALKTEDFLRLNRRFREAGVKPLAVKGIICRNLYPSPDSRTSGDEDVYCGLHQFKSCHKVMVDFGMESCGSSMDGYEVPYRKSDSPLYIELHKTLFPEDSDIFGDCNSFFENAFDRSMEVMVQGEPVATLNETDHMLYLIVHAFKHFLHSGFGIRQVCDIVLFANTYGKNVDWDYVLTKCRGIRADKFAAALFAIGEKYLVFSPEKSHYPHHWREIQVEPEPILEDLLYGGIYGSSDRSRVHSSNMTLNAVASDKKGKGTRGNLLKTIFPSAQNLENRFPYLHRKPYLLPVAWCSRIFGYARETISQPAGAAADVIRTGSKRIELLRQYDIID